MAVVAIAPGGFAQLTEQEFQMGRAREACRNQAEQQVLSVNRVVSTMPISGSGGQMIGSEVILNVSRSGSTYDVRCNYDNSSRTATITNLPSESGSGSSTTLPTEGNFMGKGLTSGAVFSDEQETEANLSFNGSNFSYTLSVPPGTGAQVNYGGTIRRLRGTGSNPNSFVLQGRVRRFASSANDLEVVNATGDCRIEVFDARVVSSSCNSRARNSSTRFEGLAQF
jgi:hypothetical protein